MTFADEAELEKTISEDIALGGTVWNMPNGINVCLNWLQENGHSEIAVEMKRALIVELDKTY